MNGGTIWIPCQRQKGIARWKHVAVKEPSTKKVLIIGGRARWDQRHPDIPDLLELTFNCHQSLKMLALERVTDNLGKLASQITELPAELKLAVKEFGSNLKISYCQKRWEAQFSRIRLEQVIVRGTLAQSDLSIFRYLENK